MKKTTQAVVAAPPQIVDGKTSPLDVVRNVRVVDVKTGETIAKVVTADADAGKLTRFEIDGDGNLVREKDGFKIIEEECELRIEWIEPPATSEDPAGTAEEGAA